jgi:AraC family transcriptional regulator of adaptative response / DNA-3-methyladenine glycosylase II
VLGRIVEAHGDGGAFPTAEAVVDAPLEALGLIGRRAETIRSVAQRVVTGDLALDGTADHDTLLAALVDIPGIGPWTASYVALRSGEPDAFPAGDLHLRRVLEASSDRDAERRAEPWRPWRAYAAMHLWQRPHRGARP